MIATNVTLGPQASAERHLRSTTRAAARAATADLDAAMQAAPTQEALEHLLAPAVAWSLGFARLQRHLQDGPDMHTAALAEALSATRPARADAVAAAMRRLGPPTPPAPPLPLTPLAALRLCVGRGLASPTEIVQLAQLEGAHADGLDPLEVMDLGVLLMPDSALLRVERAKLLERLGLPEAAAADANRALAGAALTVDIALGAADLLRRLGQSDEAASALAEAANRLPPSALLLARAALLAVAVGRGAAAEQLAQRAFAAAPETPMPQVRLILARLASSTGRHTEGLALLRPLMAPTGGEDAPEIAAAFVDISLAPIWKAGATYVDWPLVDAMEAAIARAGDALAENRLWEAARIFLMLDRTEQARRIAGSAATRRHLAGGEEVRGQLAALLRDLTLLAPGSEDSPPMPPPVLARALVRQGLALLPAGRASRAALCFEIAGRLQPEDPAARFNAGFAAMAAGRISDALAMFDGPTRVYEPDMARVAWPHFNGMPWPHGDFAATAAFEALKPEGAEWPTITVITPSFNQAAYVEETILSVLRQGYPKLQYIVVDGLSTDGAVEVIERYRDRIETVIIERDRGQTEAINKGLRLARGEIVTWLNSDDMFGPGALHMVALTWLRSQADLMFGFCLPHRERGFVLANLPAARQETFDLQHLGEIFAYWMKGFFFYQPEVFFSRRILDAVGGLLEDRLHYTMDYEFWLRCAQAGATVQPMAWPVALFRHHAEQKTANLLDCMLEQAQVRDRFLRIAPPPERQAAVRASIAQAIGGAQPRIGIVSARLSKIFSPELAGDLAAAGAAAGFEILLADSTASLPGRCDVIVKLVHLLHDIDELTALREAGFAGPVVGWFWDNHHHLFANAEVAERLDVVVPGHAFARHYLSNILALEGPALPLCVTQWAPAEARAFWALCSEMPRSDQLYGGFVRYAFAEKRNALIVELQQTGFEGVYFVEEATLNRYFGLSREDRFREWAAHKASITLPLAGDLSQRLFDALLAGQVPIVPRDVHDLDAVVPPDLQASLPIIRFDRYDAAAVAEAHRAAIAAFDAGGPAAMQARHRFVLEHHMMDARITALLAALRGLAAG